MATYLLLKVGVSDRRRLLASKQSEGCITPHAGHLRPWLCCMQADDKSETAFSMLGSQLRVGHMLKLEG